MIRVREHDAEATRCRAPMNDDEAAHRREVIAFR